MRGECPTCGVLPSPVISCLLCWHEVYISLVSSSTPPQIVKLVFKSRFNLHASCLQEEEVEEFRVSCGPVSTF